jgi:hypothetical protein
VTLSEINAVRRHLLNAGHKRLTQNQVFEALDQQREIVEQAARQSKAARRDLERARQGLKEARGSLRPPENALRKVADLEGDGGPITPFSVEEWS